MFYVRLQDPVPDVVDPELEPEDALDMDPDAPVLRRGDNGQEIYNASFKVVCRFGGTLIKLYTATLSLRSE